jgi:hypothetical protein
LLPFQVSFHKPFNPILGETYQSVFPNGVEVYAEQISHHPPVSSWQVIDPSGKFVFYGNGNWTAGIKGNHVKGRQTGINCVQVNAHNGAGCTRAYFDGLHVTPANRAHFVLFCSLLMGAQSSMNSLASLSRVRCSVEALL